MIVNMGLPLQFGNLLNVLQIINLIRCINLIFGHKYISGRNTKLLKKRENITIYIIDKLQKKKKYTIHSQIV